MSASTKKAESTPILLPSFVGALGLKLPSKTPATPPDENGPVALPVPAPTPQPVIYTRYYSSSREHSNCCAVVMDRIGTFLTDWFGGSLWLYDLARLYQPINPGFRGQCNTRCLEYFSRFFRLIRFILYLGVMSSIGLVGMLLRAVASLTSRTEMVFEQPGPDVPPPQLRTEPAKEVSIVSFNVILFPDFLCVFTGMRPSMERVIELADQLLAKNDDVICLQECWHVEATRYLVRRLRAKYPYIVWNVMHSTLTLNSGQFIASKYPITAPTFWWFGVTRGGDLFGRKGLLGATIQLTTTQKILVFTTHTPFFDAGPRSATEMQLQAVVDIQAHVRSYTTKQYGPYIDEKTGQPATAALPGGGAAPISVTFDSKSDEKSAPVRGGSLTRPVLVDRFAKSDEPKLVGTFVCGDYNMTPFSDTWHAMKSFFEVEHQTFVPVSEWKAGSRYRVEQDWSIGWNMPAVDTWWRGDFRIDWILVGSHPYVPAPASGAVIIDAMGGCSDHLAIRGTYQFGPQIKLAATANGNGKAAAAAVAVTADSKSE